MALIECPVCYSPHSTKNHRCHTCGEFLDENGEVKINQDALSKADQSIRLEYLRSWRPVYSVFSYLIPLFLALVMIISIPIFTNHWLLISYIRWNYPPSMYEHNFDYFLNFMYYGQAFLLLIYAGKKWAEARIVQAIWPLANAEMRQKLSHSNCESMKDFTKLYLAMPMAALIGFLCVQFKLSTVWILILAGLSGILFAFIGSLLTKLYWMRFVLTDGLRKAYKESFKIEDN